MRKITEITNDKIAVKVMYDAEWQEYRCKLFVDGQYQGEKADHHTDDKEDAIETAKAMMIEAKGKSHLHTLKTGAVIYNSWGYEQTNIDFYQVVKVTKCFVSLRPIEAIKSEDGPTAMTGKTIPVKGRFASENITRHKAEFWRGQNVVKFTYGAGCEWDGKPKRYSSYA